MVLARRRRLERAGVIEGYRARRNPQAQGYQLLAFILVALSEMKTTTRVGERLAAIPGVQEVHHNAGEYCFLLKVRCRGTDQLRELLLMVNAIEEVRATQTIIVLKPIKECGGLPLAG